MSEVTSESYRPRLDRLRADVIEQSRRVQAMIEGAFEALFAGDIEGARRVVDQDDVIDRVDVEIERATVKLLAEGGPVAGFLDAQTVRSLLTIAKVNNELERIADLGAAVAERTDVLRKVGQPPPPTLRVIANSVIGILRDMTRCVQGRDPVMGRVVLSSESTVEAFKERVLQDAQDRIGRGEMDAAFGFLLHDLACLCERMADHATNVAEQVIYSATGVIVRHTDGRWLDVPIKPGEDASAGQ